MKFVTKEQYKNAVEQVKLYEQRQKKIEQLKKELGVHLDKFFKFSFKTIRNETIFAGYMLDENNKNMVLIGSSYCNKTDKYNPLFGKLIAVRKALKIDIEDIVELAEPKKYFTGGFIGNRLNDNYSPVKQIINYLNEMDKAVNQRFVK